MPVAFDAISEQVEVAARRVTEQPTREEVDSFFFKLVFQMFEHVLDLDRAYEFAAAHERWNEKKYAAHEVGRDRAIQNLIDLCQTVEERTKTKADAVKLRALRKRMSALLNHDDQSYSARNDVVAAIEESEKDIAGDRLSPLL